MSGSFRITSVNIRKWNNIYYHNNTEVLLLFKHLFIFRLKYVNILEGHGNRKINFSRNQTLIM